MRLRNTGILNRTGKWWQLATFVFFACVGAASADTVTMRLIGPPPGPSLAGIYTDPYTATINGVATPVICDDFYTDVSISTPPWTATVTNLATIQTETSVSNVVKFGTSGTLADQIKNYTVLGYLANQLMSYDPNSQQAKDLSYSIWHVFDQDATNGPFAWLANHGYTTDLANAQAYYDNAVSAYNTGQTGIYSNVTIYTPDPLNASQEYLTVSEPGFTLQGWLALGLLGLLWSGRRGRLAAAWIKR